jgi:WD40 repeat protein
LKNGQTIHILQGPVSLLWYVAVTPDGRLEVLALKYRVIPKSHTDLVEAVMPDGSCVFVRPDDPFPPSVTDRGLRFLDLESGQIISRLQGHREPIYVPMMLFDGRRGVWKSWHGNGMLRLVDFESGETIRTLRGHTDLVNALLVNARREPRRLGFKG